MISQRTQEPVAVTLRGGLGNQLFQFAAGYAISSKLGVGLELDLSELRLDKKRSFELGYLKKYFDFRLTRTGASAEKFGRLVRRVLKMRIEVPTFAEASFTFDRRFEEIDSPVRLHGYFQSHLYFSSIDRKQLKQLIPPATLGSQDVEAKIMAGEAVAVHVRRGDYVSEKHTNAFHGVLSEAYYAEAAQIIASKLNSPKFFVFSDEPEWIKANFKLPFSFEAVDISTAASGLADLRLMAICKHHIIANSTMSWWAAYLGQHKDQIVVAPKNWFAQNQNSDKDLIPRSWLRIG